MSALISAAQLADIEARYHAAKTRGSVQQLAPGRTMLCQQGSVEPCWTRATYSVMDQPSCSDHAAAFMLQQLAG